MGDCDPMDVLPQTIKRSIDFIDHYIVENEKTARKSIKMVQPEKKQSELVLFTLNKHTENKEHLTMIQPLLEGKNMGLMSEAGCPGVADPGAVIVKIAHDKGIQVVPLVGPSSILLALMASGMNGQSFTFNGYLPIEKEEKKSALKFLEKLSFDKNQSQIFIETPYRNTAVLQSLLQTLQSNTRLATASGLTLVESECRSDTIKNWKQKAWTLHNNQPAVFAIGR